MDIKEITPEEVTAEEAKGLISSLADCNCSKCYGRGYTMRSNPLLCKRVKKSLIKRRTK
jgi:hypothetical protein